MKKLSKAFAIALVVAMLFTSFAYAGSESKYYGGNTNSVLQTSARLSAPKNVSASGYSNGIKIVWSKVEKASKYYVYRATSKDGTYKRIGSTSKLVYKDTTAKPSRNYYYKVKAFNSNYKKSYYSKPSYAKWKVEKISCKWYPEFVDELPFTLGEVRELKVSYNHNRDITAYYDDEYINVEWQGDSLFVYCESNVSTKTKITIKYDGFGNVGSKSVDVLIEGNSGVVKDYEEFQGVPEFGSELGISPDFVQEINGFRSYMYHFSTLEAVGENPSTYMYSYIETLKSRGFYLVEKLPIETGIYQLFSNGKRQVLIQSVEKDNIKGIVVAVK